MADETPKDPQGAAQNAAESERRRRREATTIEGEAKRLDPPASAPAPAGGSALVPAAIGGLAGAALASLVYLVLPSGAPAGLTARLDQAENRAKAANDALAQLEKRLAAAEAAAKSATAGVAGAGEAAKTAEGVARGAEGLAKAAAGAAEAARRFAGDEAARLESQIAALPKPLAGAPVDLAPLEARLTRAEQTAQEARRAAAQGVPAPDLKPLEDRLAALESRAAPSLKPVEDHVAQLTRDLAAAAQGQGERLAALEKRIPAPVDLAPVAGRLEALEKRFAPVESSLAEQKSEARVTAEREAGFTASSRATAVAVAAQSAIHALDQGRAFAAEVATLEALGVDAARLAPLKRFAAAGAPTAAALAAQFAPLAARTAANAAPEGGAGLGDRLAAAAGRLVQVRRMGEGGDDAASLTTRVEEALARGATGEAFVAWAKLPGPAKASSQAFGDALSARVGAETAARGVLSEAIAALGRSKS